MEKCGHQCSCGRGCRLELGHYTVKPFYPHDCLSFECSVHERPKCEACGHFVAYHRHHEDSNGVRFGSKHYCDGEPSYENNGECGCTVGAPERSNMTGNDEPLAIFYAIRNQQGQFYRTYSRNSSSGWQDKLVDARLWTKPAGAKSKITALANERPTRPIPELVEFVVREVRVVDQKDRVAQSRAKKELEDARRAEANKKWRLEQEQHALERAQQELERAQERVRKLQGQQ